MATTAAAQHSYQALPFSGEKEREIIASLHEGNTKTRADPPNPVSMQDHSCSDLPSLLRYKHTYPKKWFLFADAKRGVIQYNSVHHDDTREF